MEQQRRCVDLGELAAEWRGWFIDEQGRLCGDAVRWKFEPGDLLAYPYSQAETKARARENDQLKRELDRAGDELESSERAREFYRRNLVAESRLGVLGAALALTTRPEGFGRWSVHEAEEGMRKLEWRDCSVQLSGEDCWRLQVAMEAVYEAFELPAAAPLDDPYFQLGCRLIVETLAYDDEGE